MRRTVLILACLIAVSVGSLAGATVVLASGTSTSAGDQQYVDPLTSTTSTPNSSGSSSSSSGSSSGSSGSSSSSSGASSSAGSSSSQTSSSTASGSSSSSGSSVTASTASAHGKPLPFTGMNVGACVALGLGLLGTGLALRRLVHTI